jgi:hypothetical protein
VRPAKVEAHEDESEHPKQENFIYSYLRSFFLVFGGVKGAIIVAAIILGGEFILVKFFWRTDFGGFMWVTVHFVLGPLLTCAFIIATLVKVFYVKGWSTRIGCLIIPVPFCVYLFMAVTGDPRWFVWLMPAN